MLVGVLLAVVYGYLNYESSWSTLFLILTSVVVMLIANFVRILVIIALGVYKGMDYPMVQDHENLGWVLFAIFLIPMFVIARYLNPNIWSSKDILRERSSVGNKNIARIKLVFASVFYLLIISIAPLYAGYLENNIKEIAHLDSQGMVPSIGWVESKASTPSWEPDFSLYSENFVGQFTKEALTVKQNTYLYSENQPKGELINTNNKLVDGTKWLLIDASYNKPLILDGVSFQSVNKITVNSAKAKDCIRAWYWFDVGGKSFSNKTHVKLYEVYMVFKGRSGSALTSISTNCNEKADQILAEYLDDNIAQIKNLINW